MSIKVKTFLLRLVASILTFSVALLVMEAAVFAQPGNSALSFPSANNSFLGKTVTGANIGVDRYTGAAQVSVPLCNLASKSLNIPLSLSYVDGRGVKVQEYASQVGLGWQLNAGGSISRVVRGLPDEEPNGYLGTGPGNGAPRWGQVVTAGSQDPPFNINVSAPNFEALEGQTSNRQPSADGEPDLYYVKTPYFSFQFVLDQNGKPVFSNYNGYKVIASNIVANTLVTPTNFGDGFFEVIDDQGNQFYFGSSPVTTEVSTDTLYGSLYTFESTWYLDRIVAFNSQDVITLTYQAGTNPDVTYNYSWTELISEVTFKGQYSVSSGKNTIANPKYVKTITSSLGEADFGYAFDRQDDPAAARLITITLKAFNPQTNSNSTLISTYSFFYNYFNSSSGNPNLMRLCLNSVVQSPSSGSPLTLASFVYNVFQNLPDRTLPVFDYWGYCTTVQSPVPGDLPNINRNPDPIMTQAGILTSVQTPMGGLYSLAYELNTYAPSNNTGKTNVGGLRVHSITQSPPSGASYTQTYQYEDANGNSWGQIYNTFYNALLYNFQVNGGNSLYLSNSPYVTNDLNGVFVGYSYVKEVEPDGGYTLYNFSNFNDQGCSDGTPVAVGTNTYPNLIPGTSVAYKRGLLKQMSVYSYNAASNTYQLLSQTTNSYFSFSSVTNSAYGFRPINFPEGGGLTWTYWGLYSTPIENYLLSQSVHTDYDQVNPAVGVTTTTNYNYTINAAANAAFLSTTSTTDSKGQNHTQTFFHPTDGTSIPMISGTAESQTLSAMTGSNCINKIVHTEDSRNGTIHHVHYTYGQVPINTANNVYLTSVSNYSGSFLQSQRMFNYDAASSQLISSNIIPGKPTATSYAYNTSYPVASVINASNTATTVNQPSQVDGTFLIRNSLEGIQSTQITTTAAGTITVDIASPGGEVWLAVSLRGNATGYSSSNVNICSGSSSCPVGVPSGTQFTGLAPDTYTLSVIQNVNNTTPLQIPVGYTYPGLAPGAAGFTEYFYQGFEQLQTSAATQGAAHTGNMYSTGDYIVPYNMPNSRSYLIQWWSLSGGKWVFHQQAYSNGMTLAGPVDDVRVFPSDALMTTYTYNPLLGKTSETDPSGKTQTYEYDGMGRPLRIRDQDGNILKQFDYQYQVPIHQ